jgi:enoyl-CoA hydratase/carnithine racemase
MIYRDSSNWPAGENAMPSAESPTHFERVDDVGIITMTFAPHNLIGRTLSVAIVEELEHAHSAGCRAIILKSGLRHFSAGAELELFENGGERLSADLDVEGVLRTFEGLPIPIIASVHGVAVGGGFELALASDMIIAAASSKMGLVEVSLGLQPLMGGVQRVIQRAGVNRGKEIVMLGRRHDAATLEKWGIVNRVVPDDKLADVTMAIARELANGPTVAHGATKRLANVFLAEGMKASDEAMTEIRAPVLASEDLKRGLAAFQTSGPGSAVFKGD